MSREKGTFLVPANYEPQKAAPFDARMKVESKVDLTLEKTWKLRDGEIWLFDGLIVAVATDIEPSNNGIYMLLDALNYMDESAWMKCADKKEISALQKQIDEIQTSGGAAPDIAVETEDDLPEVGDPDITYFVKENASIQRWDAEAETYISYGGSGADLDINLIHGGKANE